MPTIQIRPLGHALRLVMALLLLAPIAPRPPTAHAATARQVTRIVGLTNNEEFGAAIALSGDTLAVGAPAGSGRGLLTGVAYVFVRTADGWRRQATLQAPDGTYSDRFGAALAIDGDTIAVGAPGHSGDDNAWAAGMVYIFARSGETWSLQTTLIAGDRILGGYDDLFGRSVAIERDTLVVGSDLIGTGSAYLYARSGTTWSQQAKLLASDRTQGANFGAALAISRGRVLVGAPSAAAAYVFEQGPAGWIERQKLTSSSLPGDSQRFFGQSVAIDGDTLAVGAPNLGAYLPAARAYVFTRGSAWTLQATLGASDDSESYSFGMAISISGDSLLVGAPEHHLEGYPVPNLVGAGAAYLYRRSGSAWSLAALLSPDRFIWGGSFGKSVIASGDQLLAGLPRSSGPLGSADGAVDESRLGMLTRAVDDLAATPEDAPLAIPVLANDVAGPSGSLDPSYFDIALLQRPAHGDVSVDQVAGTIVYTPTRDYSGQDSFGYVAGWGLPATVTVTVSPQPDPPVFTSAPPTNAVERIPYTYRVTAADPDLGDRLAFSADRLPGWLTLTDNGDGTAVLSGTAALADVGTYPLSLLVQDSDGLRATQPFTIEVESFVPSAPADLTAEAISRSRVQLNWRDASNNEQGFTVERRSDGGEWARIAILAANTTGFTDLWRTCNTRYDYRVSAFNARGSSPPSPSAGVAIADCTLAAPAELRATTVTTSSIGLIWADLSDNESGFTIERSPDGIDGWSAIGQAPVNQAYYLDREQSCGVDPFYRVRAYNPGGATQPSNVVRGSVCPPAAPSDLTARPGSQTSVALEWSDNSLNERGFQIEISRDDGASWAVTRVAATDATTATIEWLSCDTPYRFRVRSFNPSGGAYSNTAVTTTDPCTVLHVDARAGGRNDGSSWANAYTDLQSALQAAATSGQDSSTIKIWVAAGTYRPTGDTNRGASFWLVSGVAIYGGFRGDETALGQRDWRANPTILSGDIGAPGDMSDNSYSVVASRGVDRSTLLDGFTITAGHADGSWVASRNIGGGMYNEISSPTVRNCIFIGNYAGMGGGMGNRGNDVWSTYGSSPSVENVSFLGNSAGSGGAMANIYASSPELANVAFSGNLASEGGALYNYWNARPWLTNTTFTGNRATQWGGAITNSANAQPAVHNSILWGNRGPAGGEFAQIFNTSSNAYAIVSDSLLEWEVNDQSGGVRNRVGDPLFVDADGADNLAGTPDDDLRLQSESPAVDAGNNDAVPPWATTDLGGSPRRADHRNKDDTGVGAAPIVDIGAYEYQPPPPPGRAPSGLSAAAASRTGIALTWADNSDDEQGFKLERRAGAAGAWTELVRLPAGTTSYADSPLPCGTGYAYRVRAYNPGGDSAPSNIASAATEACVPQTIYVDRDATGANDGSSWADAYTSLQSALTPTTIRGDQIWLAEGTYKPTGGADRAATFRLIPGVAIYGGFGGGETALGQRDWRAHPAILSGDLAGNDPPAGAPTIQTIDAIMGDNSYHVITSAGGDRATVLDGLTIAGGNACGAPGSFSGGGMLNSGGSPTLRDITFRSDAASRGGGMANLAGSVPALTRVSFVENLSCGDGGGMYNEASSPTLEDVTFERNHSHYGGGAGMYNHAGSPALHNVAFTQNDAYWDAGGMLNEASSPTLVDVTFEGNQGDVGGMQNISSSPTLRRVMFKGNTARNTDGGGGMHNDSSSPTLIDVTFVGNISYLSGGGMYNIRSSPTLIDVVFAGNLTPRDNTIVGGGGGMFNVASSPLLIDVVFSGNAVTATYSPLNHGGAISNAIGSSPTLVNVTFSGNIADVGGAMYSSDDSHPSVRNSIFWGDVAGSAPEIFAEPSATTVVSDSIVRGGYAGPGNRDADPLFADADGPDNLAGTPDDDLRPGAGSPAIDAADSDALPQDEHDLDGDGDTAEPLPLDLDGSPRRADDSGVSDTGRGTRPIVDMGAHEFQYTSPGPGEPALLVRRPGGAPVPPGGTIMVGSSNVGVAVETSIVVVEIGGARLDVSAPAGGPLGGANAGDFSLPGGAPPFSVVDGGAAHAIVIRCTPGAAGRRSATLTLQTNAPAYPTLTYRLECQGPTPPAAPQLTIGEATGQSGSAFLVSGAGYPADTRLRVVVSGLALGTVTTSHEGTFALILQTLPAALSGVYTLAVTPADQAGLAPAAAPPTVSYTLDPAAPLREPTGPAGAYALTVPEATPPQGGSLIYLSVVGR